ncbi:MAG TPA: NAD-dependent epimerase/dehydratase family protein, partial [Bacteroidales bacterium]|nr:NAD-dependent epimerase/dehydratase family protein [Bacteroidales bacterium]
MDKKSKIAVLGASGLVGGAIARTLIERGYRNIIGTYNSKKPSTEGITPVKVDLTKQMETEEFFKEFQPEYVFLAAAKVGGILANNTYKADFIYENLSIALNVIHSAYKYGIRKLLNLGSSCIYPKYAPQPMKEEYLLTGSLEPTNEPYAIAKISAIKLCRYYNEQYGTNFISVMPTNLYGPGDNFNLETSHVLPALIRKFHLAELLEQGDLEGIKRDFQKHPIGFGLDEKIDYNNDQSIIEVLSHLGITSHVS